MTVETRGIQTTYRNTRFRSRLEARWAAFFDAIGWRWTYEPLDADGYIPDFLIHGERPMFIEVGPCITPADFVAKSEKPTKAVDDLLHDVLVVGIDPVVQIIDRWTQTVGWLGERFSEHVCVLPGCNGVEGWLSTPAPLDGESVLEEARRIFGEDNRVPCPNPGVAPSASFDFAWGFWARCGKCGSIGVYHSCQSYAIRPCGHHDGDHYLGPVGQTELESAWAQATNGSQWRSR